MSWLNRVRDRISKVVERVRERLFETPEDRERERVITYERERVEEERFKITVFEKEPAELRPFSSLFQYSAKTKTYREKGTGRFVSQIQYQQELAYHRFLTSFAYIQMAHPEWAEEEILEAIERLEELRAKSELTPTESVELGALFSP